MIPLLSTKNVKVSCSNEKELKDTTSVFYGFVCPVNDMANSAMVDAKVELTKYPKWNEVKRDYHDAIRRYKSAYEDRLMRQMKDYGDEYYHVFLDYLDERNTSNQKRVAKLRRYVCRELRKKNIEYPCMTSSVLVARELIDYAVFLFDCYCNISNSAKGAFNFARIEPVSRAWSEVVRRTCPDCMDLIPQELPKCRELFTEIETISVSERSANYAARNVLKYNPIITDRYKKMREEEHNRP